MLCLSIIPQQYKSYPLDQDAINEGFKFNGQENIISLEKYSKTTNQGRHGNHPAYSDQIETQLNLHSKGEGTATGQINSMITETRTKITKDEYEKGVEEINRKGQNGLDK